LRHGVVIEKFAQCPTTTKLLKCRSFATRDLWRA